MRPSPERPRLRKREIVFAVAAGVVAAGGAALILDSDGSGSGSPQGFGEKGERTYQVANFERISTVGPQDIEIGFGEAFAVHAEGAVNQLEVIVENGELVIRPREGIGWNWAGFDSTKIQVTMPRLTRVSLNGSGDVSIEGGLKGDRFAGLVEGFSGSILIDALEVDQADFTINGPGEIVAAGTARAAHMTINGPGEIQAGELRTRTAAITVNGPGDVELAVEQEADVSVQGPGEVDIDGPARCSISTSGPGSVSCGSQDGD